MHEALLMHRSQSLGDLGYDNGCLALRQDLPSDV